jgi:hypothetical protein
MLRPWIQLFIDGQEVDFTEPININMTYAHQDLHNPTVVRNSFSKTLKIDGTPKNNRIFGCFGNMDRIAASKEGEYTGASFNPSRKVDFALVRNGEQIERGYVKLDKVVKKGKKLSYDITLYGGLGQFLYNLTTKEDGEQMKLSDLDYGYNLDIEVNKEVVYNAWNSLNEIGKFTGDTYEIYKHINFSPCYNGIPEDFSADKVAIDVNSFKLNAPELYERFAVSKEGYGLIDGWLIGELKKEYDEWQMKDMRSYLQRPVIRFKDIIDACCNPINNGGYAVELDDEFFSADNPYYENAWMTLPLLSEIETTSSERFPILKKNGDRYEIEDAEDGDRLSFTVPMSMIVSLPNFYSDVSNLYTGVQITLNPTKKDMDKAESYNACRYAQLVVYDANGKVVNGSNVLSFYTKILNAVNFTYEPEYKTTINDVIGDYINVGYSKIYEASTDFVFNGSTYGLSFKNLEWKEGYYMKLVVKSAEIVNYVPTDDDRIPEEEKMENNLGVDWLYKKNEYYTYDDTIKMVTWGSSVVDSNVNIDVKIPTNKHISKDTLLNSEHTPCDYFLSYLKMFNLHIWSDNVEKKVYIKQRKNYFTGEKINIDGLVDRDSDITIKPIVYDAKWYNFNTEFDGDSLLNKTYKDNYGFDYGIQKVNTNYNFDSTSKDLLEKNVLKNCICNRAKSKYYVSVYEDYDNLPPFYLDGFTTLLFNGEGDTIEANSFTPRTTVKSYNWWRERGYDLMPKPDFRNKDGKGVDGSNVLLFYNGKQILKDVEENVLNFGISDDIPQFETLNDGEPCWVWSYNWNNSITYFDYLPIFSRYYTNENNWVTHSWDFGTPKQIYIPDYSIDNSSDIYTQYWKNYINDEFDNNTREVDLKVLLKGKVNPDFLQNFVYFDGCYWKIMEIVDYNPCSQETTKVKMVKVQDMNNYLI